MQFMAISALNREVHTFHHDIEWFFYVFLWIGIHYQLGNINYSRPACTPKTVLDRWGDTFEGAAIAKWGDIGRGRVGSRPGLERILSTFEDWAVELKDLTHSFRNLLFPRNVDRAITLRRVLRFMRRSCSCWSSIVNSYRRREVGAVGARA